MHSRQLDAPGSQFDRKDGWVKSLVTFVLNRLVWNKPYVTATTKVTSSRVSQQVPSILVRHTNGEPVEFGLEFEILAGLALRIEWRTGCPEECRAVESAREKLTYVYFHNFVGSEWVNTNCPGCGAEVIERFSLGCGGDKLQDFRCLGNQCPECGQGIKIHGIFVPPPKESMVTT